MVEPTQYFTYRLTNLPKSIEQKDVAGLFSKDDKEAITATSIGPSPYLPAAFNVATVTFRGERKLQPFIHYPGHDSENIIVDDTFYGLTPLNTVVGNPKAEYEHYSSP